LLGLIYFQYVKDNKTKQTMNGAVSQQTEVSTPSDNTFLYQRYNDAVRTYQAIQIYINDNIDIYPTFAGVRKKKTSFI
jgi:16S rRNA C1402 N4-methylase RsmH